MALQVYQGSFPATGERYAFFIDPQRGQQFIISVPGVSVPQKLLTPAPKEPAYIYNLPDELLLEVADYIQEPNRNTNLASLSLVSRRLRPIAQEKLICQPSFKFTHVHAFLQKLGHRHTLIPKIRRLEIFSSTSGRVPQPTTTGDPNDPNPAPDFDYPALPCPRDLFTEPNFRARCLDVINYFFTSDQDDFKKAWYDALNSDVIQGLIAIMLVILPNLEELYIGATWIMDWPIFSSLKPRAVEYIGPYSWEHKWMEPILQHIKGKLHVLEFPANMDEFEVPWDAKNLFDFRAFQNLRTLSMPMDALFYADSGRISPPDPAHIFPPTLELLRVSECNSLTANIVNEICLAKKKHKLPALKRIELYHWSSYESTRVWARARRAPGPAHSVQKVCANAQIEIYIHFPHTCWRIADMGVTPWSVRWGERGSFRITEMELEFLRKDGYTEEELGPEFHGSELHSDVEGDFTMPDFLRV